MKWVFSAFVVLWSLRAIEDPASADLWPNDVFTKITPGKVATWRLSNPIGLDVLRDGLDSNHRKAARIIQAALCAGQEAAITSIDRDERV